MRRITLIFLYAVLLASLPAMAGTIIWNGSSSTNFATGANWNGNTAPSDNITTDLAVFPGVVTANQPSLVANRSVSGLVFQATTGGWILGGSGRTLAIGAAGIDDSANTSGTDTINAAVTFDWSQTWNVGTGGPGLMINATGRPNCSSCTLTVSNGIVTLATLDLTGRSLAVRGNGILAITGAATPGSTNAGNSVSIESGTVLMGNKDALGFTPNFTLGNDFTNAALSASIDLTGANRITNSIRLNNTKPGMKSIVSGSHSIEFGSDLYTTSYSSGYNVYNNLDIGKALFINNWRLNDNNAKTFTLGGVGETVVNGTISAGVATPNGTILQYFNTGLMILNGSNTFIGPLEIYSGVVRLVNSNALNGGTAATGGLSELRLDGGVVELAFGDFSRGIADISNSVYFTTAQAPYGGGFSAFGGKRRVNLGGASAGVTWWTSGFFSSGGVLMLGSSYADSEIEFQNSINLNSKTAVVQVADNPATNGDFATISGVVSNGALVKTGAGKLVLAGTPNYFSSGVTVSNGTLVINGASTGSVMNVVSGGVALVNGSFTGPVTVGAGGGLGGTGTLAAGSLTLSSNSVLQVTILDTLGHSDALTVTGLLNVSNMVLQVVNTNLLTLGQNYRVATCGSHTNVFAASNLPSMWTIDYANPGDIQMRSRGYPGTMIKIQ